MDVLYELTANVLFAVAESYSLLGKAQRWEVVDLSIIFGGDFLNQIE